MTWYFGGKRRSCGRAVLMNARFVFLTLRTPCCAVLLAMLLPVRPVRPVRPLRPLRSVRPLRPVLAVRPMRPVRPLLSARLRQGAPLQEPRAARRQSVQGLPVHAPQRPAGGLSAQRLPGPLRVPDEAVRHVLPVEVRPQVRVRDDGAALVEVVPAQDSQSARGQGVRVRSVLQWAVPAGRPHVRQSVRVRAERAVRADRSARDVLLLMSARGQGRLMCVVMVCECWWRRDCVRIKNKRQCYAVALG